MRTVLSALLLLQAVTASGEDAALAGTRWELVTIQSMDDSSLIPDDPAKYTLAFAPDYSVAIRSDCNRVTGSWASPGPGQLTFGALAGRLAACTAGSLDDAYRAQFGWVRSYVLQGGHLFLATMADGSIIEFRPAQAQPPVARLLGQELHLDNPEEAQSLILTRLFDRYAARNGLAATDAEVAACLAGMDRQLRADLGEAYRSPADLPPQEAAEAVEMRETLVRSLIRQWKVNRALYRQYGGRVIYQQLGPEPLDAYRQFLEERQAAGDFELLNEATAGVFWAYFTDEQRHDFMDETQARKAFSGKPCSP